MQRIATSKSPHSQAPTPAATPKSRWLRPLSPKSSIYLGIRPVAGTGREVKDALLEYTSPPEAAAFVFSCSPAATLSQEWRLIVVSGDTAYSYSIDTGAVLIPSQPQSWRALRRSDLAWRYPRVGYTVYSFEEIGRKAVKISWPMRYSLYSENGQKFTHALCEAIRLPSQQPSVADTFFGLEKIPEPFRTLRDRILALVFVALLSARSRVCPFAQRVLGPVWPLMKLGARGMDLLMLSFSIAWFALILFLRIVVIVFSMAGTRDLLKASRELRNIAAEVRRFDGYGWLEQDQNKLG